ncbi:hypothetical protein CASFOL_003060 [Castilleja foliolosa]|uniref:Uncharacterized protein n=1 Tax=Castilleja foliolosa TaxID=1961234 RepID=A0ABD3EJG6_9LAMI
METSNSDATNLEYASPSSPSNGRGIFGFLQSRTMRFLQSPISTLIDYSALRIRPDFLYSDAEPLIPESISTSSNVQNPGSVYLNDAGDGSGNSNSGSSVGREVSIRIMEADSVGGENDGVGLGAEGSAVGGDGVNGNVSGNNISGDSNNNNREGSLNQRYDILQAVRWIEQILPFSLLLLIVFIRQHLQGIEISKASVACNESGEDSFLSLDINDSILFANERFTVTIFSTVILFNSNDVLQKQTALKGERKVTVLVSYAAFLTLNVLGIYWLKWEEDLCYPLLMIPPRTIPPFWHAVYIIVVNDIMARQAAMLLKFLLLMYYKNGKGHNFRRQGQMLTLVEYTLLLYRALLPTPVWYRFFLNKDYGSLFSSLTTGLYLTFKITSIVERVQSFFSAIKALTRKEVHYGSNATPEQMLMQLEIYALYAKRRCRHRFYCVANIYSAKTVFQNGSKERGLAHCAGL